jgi:hypothetical protein
MFFLPGMEITRSYTAVIKSLSADNQDDREGRVVYLMIKIYKDGALTPWIGTLSQGKKGISRDTFLYFSSNKDIFFYFLETVVPSYKVTYSEMKSVYKSGGPFLKETIYSQTCLN